jgi:hypothetical protein
MRFSNMVDYKGVAHYVVKTGRKNIRILLPGQPYEKSFVVPLKKVSNRRPAEYVEEPDDEVENPLDLEDDPAEELEEADLEDEQYQPQ